MAAQELNGARILVVDDEPLIALDLAETLTARGAIVAGPCHALEAALDAARMLELDLAVLDIDLHGTEVFPVARVLRERDIPFLFQTGHRDREPLHHEFADAPVHIKPVVPRDLLACLTALLDLAA